MKNRRRRFQHSHEVDSEGSWAISYGDMVTLLLTFFIIFFSSDKFITQKKSQIDMNAKEAMSAKAVRDIASELTEISNPMLPDGKIADEVKGRVFKSGNRIVVEFSGISFFASGELDVSKEGKIALNKFYKAFSPYIGNYVLSIRAFTDVKKVRADNERFKDNLELSALRSISVMRVLQKKGVPLVNMKLAGYGELKINEREVASVLPDQKVKTSLAHDLARTTVIVIEPREEK